MWVGFANAKPTHIFSAKIFSKNISIYAICNDQSFNDTLTNDIVSFEQLNPRRHHELSNYQENDLFHCTTAKHLNVYSPEWRTDDRTYRCIILSICLLFACGMNIVFPLWTAYNIPTTQLRKSVKMPYRTKRETPKVEYSYHSAIRNETKILKL